jgi:Protein of unknown function (DUF3313)
MKKSLLAVVATAFVVVTGCVSSSQARNVKPSAFLGDTALLLKKGGKNDHLLVYRNEDAKWTSYDKIILDPITIWGAESSKLPPEALADLQKLVDHFHQTLADKLSKDYQLTDVAAPGAMRMQIAIINGERANAPLKVAKTVAPFAGTADMLWSFATGKPAFAGDVSIEYMVRDSETGTLLVAGDDRRVGGTQLDKATVTRWGDVQNILIYWSDEAVYFLCRDRKGEHCVKPKAGLVKNPVW